MLRWRIFDNSTLDEEQNSIIHCKVNLNEKNVFSFNPGSNYSPGVVRRISI